MPRKKIYLRGDFSSEIGYGHIRRLQTFSSDLIESGFDVTILTRTFDFARQTAFFSKSQLDFTVVFLKDETEFMKRLSEAPPDALIIDLRELNIYDETRSFLKTQPAYPILSFDYFYNSELFFDAVIRPFHSLKNENVKSRFVLSGAEYFILPKEIVAPKKSTEKMYAVRNVLTTMGGADPRQGSGKIIESLCPSFPDMNFRVVVGPGFSEDHSEDLIRLEKLFSNVRLELGPSHLGDLLSWADFAITSAGLTKYETAFFGVPSLIFAQNEQEVELGMEFQKLGTCVFAGRVNSIDSDCASKIFLKIIKDQEALRRMATQGPLVVDGKGSQRLVEFIQQKIFGSRKAL